MSPMQRETAIRLSGQGDGGSDGSPDDEGDLSIASTKVRGYRKNATANLRNRKVPGADFSCVRDPLSL